MSCVIGFDFGTESMRALLVAVDSGEEIAEAVVPYEHGVITESLPVSGAPLEPGWALQHPGDYLEAIHTAVPQLLRDGRVSGDAVVGIGIDFTSCTILPTTRAGVPLCFLHEFEANPHAWVKLWKHHAAQPEADLINAVAADRGEGFLKYYGGRISSEWALPKLLQILNEAPEIYRAADRFLEAADWVVWQLTGRECRNACAAGYKALWNAESGYPSRDFLRRLDPRFEDAVDVKLRGEILAPGQEVGELRPEVARALGLTGRVAVAAPIIDAHAGVLGCGVTGPGRMVMIMGTSSCQIAMAERLATFSGYAGVVRDGIVPGYYAYEYGQSAVGDILAWFLDNCIPHAYFEEARARGGLSMHALLDEKASRLAPGETGLVALDWHNGNRSVLMDADLKGMVLGYTLRTKPEDVYRALVEATAFGARKIVETHEAGAGGVGELLACGGLTRSTFVMQVYADVLGRPIHVGASSQPVTLGACILGAVGAEARADERGEFGEPEQRLARVAASLVRPSRHSYQPVPERHRAYDRLYEQYIELHDYFGAGAGRVLMCGPGGEGGDNRA